ncbi:urease accessory protein [Leucothrix arctica]|uniref:Urease accessory protein UreD n=1 Tax=Leucothrix arctica TaxID=1481894 RepID=A0A317C8X0_9GAMM|nr:urease accessory protein [Leucothrix arctica]
MEPSSGWKAKLELGYVARETRTVLAHRSRRGPLAVQRAFYPEGAVCHSYILHPPGGVVGGDELLINVSVDKDAQALLTTPGATKFYRSLGDKAHQVQRFTIAENACLEWLPQETIFFPGANAGLSTQIQLHALSRYIGWEVHCLGRPTNNERFESGQVLFSTDITRDDKPLYKERLFINGLGDLDALAGLNGYPVTATLIALPATDEVLQLVRQHCQNFTEQHKADGFAGATLLNDVLVVRYLGNSTELAHRLFRNIWLSIRPFVNGLDAVSPRIWST